MSHGVIDADPWLTYPRVLASPDGETHFQDRTVRLSSGVSLPGIPPVDVAAPQPVSALTIARVDAGYTSDWHVASRRQFVLIAAGALEVTVSDGEVRRFEPGSVFLVQDTTGKGYRSRAVGPHGCTFITVACC